MKKKQVVRLNESQLHSIIKESVKKVLKEYSTCTHTDIEDEILQYYVDCYNKGKCSFNFYGDTFSEAVSEIYKEGYEYVTEICDDLTIWKLKGRYYIIDLEEDEEGGWGSYNLDISKYQKLIKQL